MFGLGHGWLKAGILLFLLCLVSPPARALLLDK
jgi:hypothetical protein